MTAVKWLTKPAGQCLLMSATAVALRVAAVYYYAGLPETDAREYHVLGTNLAYGLGYCVQPGELTAFRVCGYPMFLAGVYLTCGPEWRVAMYCQAVLGAGLVLAVVWMGWMVVGRRAGLLAGWLTVFYPGFVWLPRVLLSENLSVPLHVLAVCVTVSVVRRPGLFQVAALGAVLGLNLLVRGGSAFMVGLTLLAVAAFTDARWFSRRGITTVAMAVAAMSVVMSPWWVRNYAVFHTFVPIATEDGISLYTSYWPPRVGPKAIWGNVPGNEDAAVAAAHRSGDEVAVSRHLKRTVAERLRSNPGHAIRLMPTKLLMLIVPLDWEVFPHAPGQTRSLNLAYLVTAPLALLGGYLVGRRRCRHQWCLWLLPLSTVLLAVVFYGGPRFRLPAEPALLVFTSCGLCGLWDRVRPGRAKQPVASGDGEAADGDRQLVHPQS